MAAISRAKSLAPIVFSLVLLAGAIWRVSPDELAKAAAQVDWRLLLPATLLMVVALYLWDAVCLPAVYRVDGQRIRYRESLHLRGLSYFGGALNYELGQAALAWGMARLQNAGLVQMLTRSVLLAYHDILLLLSVGLVGSLLSSDSRAERLRPLIATGLVLALAVGVIIWLLPASLRRAFRWADSDSLLEGWSIARSARLLPLRFVYFGILVVYASVALAICRLPVDRVVVASTVPMVLLADGLPNFAGLGTRNDVATGAGPRRPNAMLLAMSLFWSAGMLFGRYTIALAHLAGHQWAPAVSGTTFLGEKRRMSELATTQKPAEAALDNSPRRLKILFSEGSSISARQALYDLGGRHTIDVLDPDPLCQCRFSSLVRRWHRCPPYTTDPCGYLKFLASRLKAEQYDVLLPLHDEIYLLSRVREELAKLVSVAIADFPTVAMLQSKIRFRDLAGELGFQIPATQVVSQPAEIAAWRDYPTYLKLDFGTAGQTVRLVHNRRELEAALAEFEANGWRSAGEPFLLQKPATGSQSVVRAIFNHGEMVGVHASKLLIRGVGGAATVREGVNHPVVFEHVRRFGQRLAWHGAMFGDYFYDEASQMPRYIEFNPRIGDSANASYSGVNLIQQWVDVARGGATGPLPTPQISVSTHANMLILMSRAMEGASRGELWREIGRQRRRDGLYATSNEELTRPTADRLSMLPYVWVAGRLLASPAAAKKMVHATVKNYALSADAAERIRDMPQEKLTACFK